MKRLKIGFIWELANAKEIFPHWQDGYRAAMDLVAKKHDVDWILGPYEELKVPQNKYDVLMYWGSPTDRYHQNLLSRPERKLWLYPGGGLSPESLELAKQYNVVYTEDVSYEEQLKTTGVRVIRGTATNTKLYKPEQREKQYGAFFPATFSPWKRQDLFAQAVGSEGLCVGTIQPDGADYVRACIENDVDTIIAYLPGELLAVLYNMSSVVILPIVHGSQRTLLEALGMNIPVVVSDHFKPLVDMAQEIGGTRIVGLNVEEIREAYLKSKGKKLNTRPYVIGHYGEKQFAEKLLRGIEDR